MDLFLVCAVCALLQGALLVEILRLRDRVSVLRDLERRLLTLELRQFDLRKPHAYVSVGGYEGPWPATGFMPAWVLKASRVLPIARSHDAPGRDDFALWDEFVRNLVDHPDTTVEVFTPRLASKASPEEGLTASTLLPGEEVRLTNEPGYLKALQEQWDGIPCIESLLRRHSTLGDRGVARADSALHQLLGDEVFAPDQGVGAQLHDQGVTQEAGINHLRQRAPQHLPRLVLAFQQLGKRLALQCHFLFQLRHRNSSKGIAGQHSGEKR